VFFFPEYYLSHQASRFFVSVRYVPPPPPIHTNMLRQGRRNNAHIHCTPWHTVLLEKSKVAEFGKQMFACHRFPIEHFFMIHRNVTSSVKSCFSKCCTEIFRIQLRTNLSGMPFILRESPIRSSSVNSKTYVDVHFKCLS